MRGNNNCLLCDQFIYQKNLSPFEKVFSNPSNQHILKKWENWIWGLGYGQFVEGYTLLITQNHTPSLLSNNSAIINEYLKILRNISDIYEEVYHSNIIVFEHGVSLKDLHSTGNSIVHTHLHIIPLYSKDVFKSIVCTVNDKLTSDPIIVESISKLDNKHLKFLNRYG